MAGRPGAATERPPRHPGPSGLTVSKHTAGAGSYVHRFKIQRERIKTLHEGNGDRPKDNLHTEKSLPKLPSYGVYRDHTSLKNFTRSNTIESFKLPGVGGSSTIDIQAAKKKQPLPVKTFHIKLNPEHSSLVSKSMPSLPSIPGSPSQDTTLSPASDLKSSGFPQHGKHRYQKIAFRKTIHSDKDSVSSSSPASGRKEFSKKREKTMESVYNNILPQRAIRHKAPVSEPDRDRMLDGDASSVRSLSRSRKSRRSLSKDRGISETRSEGGYFVHKKWKDDCSCLRCQMLKRQYREGDEGYNLWGQYPCHKVDFSIGLDDDD